VAKLEHTPSKNWNRKEKWRGRKMAVLEEEYCRKIKKKKR